MLALHVLQELWLTGLFHVMKSSSPTWACKSQQTLFAWLYRILQTQSTNAICKMKKWRLQVCRVDLSRPTLDCSAGLFRSRDMRGVYRCTQAILCAFNGKLQQQQTIPEHVSFTEQHHFITDEAHSHMYPSSMTSAQPSCFSI